MKEKGQREEEKGDDTRPTRKDSQRKMSKLFKRRMLAKNKMWTETPRSDWK